MTKNTQDVNRPPVANAQPGIGHNGAPPDIYVREIKKLTAIEAVLKNPKFNQTQALILIGLIVRSDGSYGNAFPGGATLAVYAKVKRTDAVFKALRELEDQFNVIRRESRGQGKSNAYTVIPERVADAVVAAYEERKAAKLAAAATQETHPSKAGDLPKPTNTAEAGEFAELVRPKRVGGADEPTRLKRAPAQTGHPPEAGATHPPKAGTYPVSIRSKENNPLLPPKPNFWQGALNPSHDVLFEDGKLTLVNGFRVQWLEEFGSEKDLDLALMQAASYVQPNSSRPLDVQVSSQLARIVRDKRDKDARYAKAASAKATPAKPFKPSRW
jgi:hypothetical protein